MATRAALESLLRARKLDNTLTSALVPPSDRATVPTGEPRLDERLGGGIPRGQISEIVGPRSSGATSLLVALLAGATRRGDVAALVDTLDRFDPESAAASGIDLSRVLWIRGPAVTGVPPPGGGGRPALPAPRGVPAPRALFERAIDRAIKALNLVLQAGGFGVVALDVADAPIEALRRLPFTTWMRLQRLIEGGETACVLLSAESIGRSSGGVTIALGSSRLQANGGVPQGSPSVAGVWAPFATAADFGRARLFRGIPIEARVIGPRWAAETSSVPAEI